MTNKSNNFGRAYEFACLITLQKEIKSIRPSSIAENSSYFAAQHAWNSIDKTLQETLLRSASSIISTLFDMEPLIWEDGRDELSLSLQTDECGKEGDVRDILIVRRGIKWEIGLSIKHNHSAVKHSRLSPSIDFGEKWFGVKCSSEYWKNVGPIFSQLECAKKNGKIWKEIANKGEVIYKPLLNAFVEEIKRCYRIDNTIPRKMVEYLLGEYDFYKVISKDSQELTQIQSFNLRGSLNKKAQKYKPSQTIPVTNLPTRIVSLGLKPNSSNTVELYMDNGWQFTFRIHNASTYVETSLKFDIQIIGMPTSIITINCSWS